MKKQKHRVYYDTGKQNVQLKIDEIFAEKIIPADDSVRLLDEIMEDWITPADESIQRTGRRPATSPVTLMKILVYAIMQGIFSSRAIESACVGTLTSSGFSMVQKRQITRDSEVPEQTADGMQ